MYEFYEGEHIACAAGGICLFLQKTGDLVITAELIKELFAILVEYGCTGCGSVPVDTLQGINDNEYGELTSNYVSHGFCFDGLCDIALSPAPSETPEPPRKCKGALRYLRFCDDDDDD